MCRDLGEQALTVRKRLLGVRPSLWAKGRLSPFKNTMKNVRTVILRWNLRGVPIRPPGSRAGQELAALGREAQEAQVAGPPQRRCLPLCVQEQAAGGEGRKASAGGEGLDF